MDSRVAKAAKLLWAAPCSLVGLAFATIGLLVGGRAIRSANAVEVTLGEDEAARPLLARLLPFRAIVLGHVIIAVGREELEELRAHELVHVQQYERWGIAFFPAYAASSVWQLLNGRHAYWDNYFEVQARSLSAGPRADRRP